MRSFAHPTKILRIKKTSIFYFKHKNAIMRIYSTPISNRIVSLTKKTLSFIFLVIFGFTSLGCATVHQHDEGIVISAKKLNEADYQPSVRTEKGVKMGGTIGAVGGSGLGIGIGFIAGLMSGNSTAVAVCTLVGGIAGGLVFGLIGATAGGGVGYVMDLGVQNAAMYEFQVKQAHDKKILTIVQHSRLIPPHSNVRILEKNSAFFIRKL